MATKKYIIDMLYFGFMDYVPKEKLINYENEYTSRKSHNTKFALSFFPKYVDFKKAIKNPLHPYDTLLLNYWIVEVPIYGIKWSKLISNYQYGSNSLINQQTKKQKRKTEIKTKLLLTKKQRLEIRKKKLNAKKPPLLHGEVIKRMKTDSEFAEKVRNTALNNSKKKSFFRNNMKVIVETKKENQSLD